VRPTAPSIDAERPLWAYVGCQIYDDVWHMLRIAVEHDQRRQGIGEWLVVRTLVLASESGATRLTLEVRGRNHPAQGLYEKLGLILLERARLYYLDTADDALVYGFVALDEPQVRASLRDRLHALEVRLAMRYSA
jgi:ribosomal-protein-alanine N-acetyltransferase